MRLKKGVKKWGGVGKMSRIKEKNVIRRWSERRSQVGGVEGGRRKEKEGRRTRKRK